MSAPPHSSSDHLHPIPSHLRPPVSRHHSNISTHSNASVSSKRPHAQHRDFVATMGGVSGLVGGEGGGEDMIANHWMFDEAEDEAEAEEAASRALPRSHSPSPDPTSDEGHEMDLDNLRDGSISRRPAWRRPSPKWIYPFIIGATLSMGMGMAPRSELFISLACLAHPPQQPSRYDMTLASMVSDIWKGDPGFSIGQDSITINATRPMEPIPRVPISASDEWFYKLQREIYEYKLSHHQIQSSPSSPAPSTSHVLPSAPLPYPTSPADDPMPPTDSPPVEEEPKPDPGREADKVPYHEIDPAQCKKDPKVQAAAAQLTMIMTLAMGVLSALTTGYWGQLSDRVGRTKIMAVVETGLLLNEVCFILVATFPYRAPGGYRALLIGPTIDGLLGGFATILATIHAYMSDVTPDGSRATVFARLGGIMMIGFACGPVLGSMIIRWTGDIMFPFYTNVIVHFIFIAFMLFLLPESLSSEARAILSKNAQLSREAAIRRDTAEREWENETPAVEISDPLLSGPNMGCRVSTAGPSKSRKRAFGNAMRLGRRTFKFLEPLAIFLPRERDDGVGKDWTMCLMGCTMVSLSMMMGIMQTKTQFTFFAYGWTSAQLGPYMSLMGFSRAFTLLVFVPIIMHYVKPMYDEPIPTPLLAQTESSSSSPPPAAPTPARRSSKLDLLTMRICLLIESTGFAILALNVSSTNFVIVSAFLSLGTASSPAFNSLALSLLPSSREAGRLFGGLAVIHALAGTLISPLLFGTLFAATVGTYAPTVFALASTLLFIALVFVMCVRLPEDGSARTAERGRSRNVKRLKSSGAGVGVGGK